MTTIALPERWTFAGLDLSSYATLTALVTGADELPPLRGENWQRSGADGRTHVAKRLDSRKVSLALIVNAMAADGSGSGAAQTRTNIDALLAVLGPRVQGTLTRLMPDGTTRSGQAECMSVQNWSEPVGKEFAALVATFEMADPYWYGASTTGPGSTSTPASPTDFTFTLAGNVRNVRRLTIDWTGPVTNPRLTNQTTGAYVNVAQAVTSGQHLIIDATAWTVLNNGVNAMPALTHGPTVALFDLAPGANSLRATAGTPGGSVLVTAYPAWY